MGNHRATQQTIARALGLSRQVVSAILGKSGDISNIRFAPRTRQQVLAEAQRQGYALPPSRPRMALLNVIVADSLGMVPDGLLFALAVEARIHEVCMQIDVVPPGARPRLLESPNASDSVAVVFPAEGNDCALSCLRRHGVRTVAVNCPTAEGLRIDFDEALGAEVLVEWFKRARRRSLVFFHPFDRTHSRLRIAGFASACARLQGVQFMSQEHGAQNMSVAMNAFLVAHPEIDGAINATPTKYGTVGTVDVSVTAPGGNGTKPSAYSYIAPGPPTTWDGT